MQGDQIGRVFAYWATGFGCGLKIYKNSATFCATFFHGTSYVLILTKSWIGYIYGDFNTNSSGTDVMIF
jgi:hypothetical protein